MSILVFDSHNPSGGQAKEYKIDFPIFPTKFQQGK